MSRIYRFPSELFGFHTKGSHEIHALSDRSRSRSSVLSLRFSLALVRGSPVARHQSFSYTKFTRDLLTVTRWIPLLPREYPHCARITRSRVLDVDARVKRVWGPVDRFAPDLPNSDRATDSLYSGVRLCACG